MTSALVLLIRMSIVPGMWSIITDRKTKRCGRDEPPEFDWKIIHDFNIY